MTMPLEGKGPHLVSALVSATPLSRSGLPARGDGEAPVVMAMTQAMGKEGPDAPERCGYCSRRTRMEKSRKSAAEWGATRKP